MFDQLHHNMKRLIRCWFSDSWPLMTVASLANWNHRMGFKNSRKKPNWRYFSDLICCRNVLKHKLKRSGLRQSPWSTPQPTDKDFSNMIGNVVVFKSALNWVVINFTKSIFKIQKSNDEWMLFGTSFVNGISHLGIMLKSSRKTWCKVFLNFLFNVVVSGEEVENGITKTRGKNL